MVLRISEKLYSGADERLLKIIDMHSHIGDDPSPELSGAEDDNSLKGVVQSWLRAPDGLNTHNGSYRLSIAGGVTTTLVLPGSANGIGKHFSSGSHHSTMFTLEYRRSRVCY